MGVQTPVAPARMVEQDTISHSVDKHVNQVAKPQTHILFMIDQLCELGGAERVLLNMIRLLPKDRFRISLATFKVSENLGLERYLSCPLHVIPIERTYGWNAFRAAMKMRKLIRSENIQIVHTFHESSDIWGGIVAKLSGCPVLVSSQRDMGFLRSSKHRLAYRIVRKMADRVLAVSEDVREFCIREDALDPNKVLTVYNGLELHRIPPGPDDSLRLEFGINEAAPLISTVAHIRKVKGIDTFVEAAGIVCKEFPNARFLVAGNVTESDYFEALKRRISELHLTNNILFPGAIENVYRLLKTSNVFCLLSRSEGFSNALIEAMACYVPCVATPVGGNKEALRDGETGYIVPVEDAAAASERILRVLRDPAGARQMGMKARAAVEAKFTSEVMIQNLTKIYLNMLREKGYENA